jgi:hypothetical protein
MAPMPKRPKRMIALPHLFLGLLLSLCGGVVGFAFIHERGPFHQTALWQDDPLVHAQFRGVGIVFAGLESYPEPPADAPVAFLREPLPPGRAREPSFGMDYAVNVDGVDRANALRRTLESEAETLLSTRGMEPIGSASPAQTGRLSAPDDGAMHRYYVLYTIRSRDRGTTAVISLERRLAPEPTGQTRVFRDSGRYIVRKPEFLKAVRYLIASDLRFLTEQVRSQTRLAETPQ